MKKIIIYIFLLSSIFSNVNADYIDVENCSNSSYYDSSCTICGKYSEKFDVGVSKKVWNWFYNTDGKEKVFSVLSNGLLTPLNGANISSGAFVFNTNWIPHNVGISGNKEVISFENNNITLNSNISDSNLAIGLITYNTFSWNINELGTYPLTQNWKYIKGEAILDINSEYNLSTSIISGGSITKKFNFNETIDSKECYLIYGNNSGGSEVTPPVIPIVVGTGICGDGVIDRPNGLGINEQCDFGSDVFDGWCNSSCRIEKTDSSITNKLVFSSYGDLVIGDKRKVFDILTYPYILNNSSIKVFIEDKLCISKNNTDTFLEGNTVCTSANIGYLNPGNKRIISNPLFLGKTENIITSSFFNDSILTVSLLGDELTSFSEKFKIRVSKPTISTIGGGTNFINNTFTDIGLLSTDLTYIDGIKNKNFFFSSIGNNSISSYGKIIDDSTIVNNIENKTNTNLDKISDIIINNSLLATDIYSLPSDKYKGFDNIYIHKGNVELFSQNIVGKSKTYIIDGGNLIISGNITSNSNIAFIVKGGDIKIDNSVTEINATLVSIKNSGIGGNIKSNNIETTLKKLLISGSVYGNTNDLILKRSYVGNNINGIIGGGTIINFSSNTFLNPPPLLSKFLGEYIISEKVSR